jgi:ATP synthase protein I
MEVIQQPAKLKILSVKQLIVIQTVFIFIVTMILCLVSFNIGLAFLYGAAIFTIPNTYFTWQSFRFSGAARTKLVAQSLYKGQVAKFILTMIMFAILFTGVNPAFPWLVFVSYSINGLVHFIVIATLLNKAL